MFNAESYKEYGIIKDMLVIGIDTDTLIHQAVFGWRKQGNIWVLNVGEFCNRSAGVLRYSTEMSYAMKVADICQTFCLEKLIRSWYCELRLDNGNSIHHAHGTPEMAICRAALKAAEEIYLSKEGHKEEE